MKKLLFCLIAFGCVVTNVFATTDDEITIKRKWNSSVVDEALRFADFTPSGHDVHFYFYDMMGYGPNGVISGVLGEKNTVYGAVDGVRRGAPCSDQSHIYKVRFERIIKDLMDDDFGGTFSLQDAARVCIRNLGKEDPGGSTTLGCGRAISHIAACKSFVDMLVRGSRDQGIADMEDKPEKICMELTDRSPIITYPVLCGGNCRRVGDDTVYLINNDIVDEYVVGDFCDGWWLRTGERWLLIDKNRNVTDVSKMDEEQRKQELLKISR